jgi:SnoaL-like domain
MGDELEERIRNLEDRAALWELVNRYGMAVDDGDYDTLLGLFAEDATFRGLQGEPTHGGMAVVDYLRSRAATAHSSRVHTPTAQVLDRLDADRAEGLVTCYAALFGHDDSESFFAFRYKDEYVRREEHWMFQSRHVHCVTHIFNR